MIINIKKHFYYYLSLLGIVFLGVLLALQVSYDRRLQALIVVIMTFFYVLWATLHHLINHDLTTKIMVEYILIGSLGMTIVLFLLKAII